MEINGINFDKNLNMSIFSKTLNKKIWITLSDELEASEEVLSDGYRKKIANFINNLPEWYDKACNAVVVWAKEFYKININYSDIELMGIYILFEQYNKELFGLDFRTSFDIEHGCGVQIRGKDDNYKIIKIATADVAFY